METSWYVSPLAHKHLLSSMPTKPPVVGIAVLGAVPTPVLPQRA
jgi:hypothetical protein